MVIQGRVVRYIHNLLVLQYNVGYDVARVVNHNLVSPDSLLQRIREEIMRKIPQCEVKTPEKDMTIFFHVNPRIQLAQCFIFHPPIDGNIIRIVVDKNNEWTKEICWFKENGIDVFKTFHMSTIWRLDDGKLTEWGFLHDLHEVVNIFLPYTNFIVGINYTCKFISSQKCYQNRATCDTSTTF